MDAQNFAWVRAQVTWGTGSGWAETIRKIDNMAPGIVSEGFLTDLPVFFCLCSFMASPGIFKIKRRQKGGGSDLAELPCYYHPIGYSDQGFEGATVHHVMPKK